MQIRRESSGILVVSLHRGESIRACIEEICAEHGILGAKIEAIGAIEDPELGYYMFGDKEYDRKSFPGIWELAPLIGNISTLPAAPDKPFMHAHVVIGGPDYSARTGHLFDGKVGVVVEAVITPFDSPLHRKHNDEIGLPRWCPIHDGK